MKNKLLRQFGDIDIYLFDQLLRGRIEPGMRILDAGCGGGRNLIYFLREGFDVHAIDQDTQAIDEIRRVAAVLAPGLPAKNWQVASLENVPYSDGFFDVIVCNAVLHFAVDDEQFNAMLNGLWRKVRAGGLLFCRLASSIGVETQIKRIDGRRYLLPDGSERYLVDAALLRKLTDDLGGVLLDPIKTTLVQDQRSMTTWVVGKT